MEWTLLDWLHDSRPLGRRLHYFFSSLFLTAWRRGIRHAPLLEVGGAKVTMQLLVALNRVLGRAEQVALRLLQISHLCALQLRL